jgi:copper resistance protein B
MRIAALLPLLLLSTGAAAQRLPYADVLSAAPPPRLAYARLEIVADEAPPPARQPEASGLIHGFYGDRFEFTPRGRGYSWDVSGEIGSAAHRLWLASSGDGAVHDGLSYVEAQALYSHPILAAGLAVQAGVQRNFARPRRTYGVVGVQGNLSTPLYVGAFALLSTKGELSANVYAYYDWEMRPRLVLQPYAGLDFAAQDVPELALGRGLSEAELGLRLRYRIAEPFSPYVGLSWDRLIGRTARIARDAGDDPGGAVLVMGVRSYF